MRPYMKLLLVFVLEYGGVAKVLLVVQICPITMSVRNQPKIHEANRRPKGRHPLFCFISFVGIYYPLTDIVIVHIVYINEANPSTHT